MSASHMRRHVPRSCVMACSMRAVADLYWLAVCACGILGTVDALKCRDASGTDVSWWTALKAPKGYIYGYIEANQRNDGCVLLYTSTNNPTSIQEVLFML